MASIDCRLFLPAGPKQQAQGGASTGNDAVVVPYHEMHGQCTYINGYPTTLAECGDAVHTTSPSTWACLL